MEHFDTVEAENARRWNSYLLKNIPFPPAHSKTFCYSFFFFFFTPSPNT